MRQVCKINGKERPGVSRMWCQLNGGEWEYVEDPPPPDPKGDCLVRGLLIKSLGNMILNIGATFPVAMDFRNKMLATTPAGRRVLKNYYAPFDDISSVFDMDAEVVAMF